MKKYCEGLDCSICNQKEPCIYKEADKLLEQLSAEQLNTKSLREDNKRLSEELKATEDTLEACDKEYRLVIGNYNMLIKQNREMAEKINTLEQKCLELLYIMGIKYDNS